MKGIFNIYKPKGPTSTDIVREIKRITGEKKVGHGGTLDPLAEGILIVGVDRKFTRQLREVVEKEKEYEAKIKLGFKSTTDDEEGEKKEIKAKKIPTKKEIEQTVKNFIGKIDQVPPKFSAGKISGEEAYKKARRGEEFSLGAHRVLIKKIEILNYKFPFLDLKVVTGPGVYIRSLARDIGKRLRTGGYLAELKRTRVGEFKIEDSIRVFDIKAV